MPCVVEIIINYVPLFDIHIVHSHQFLVYYISLL